MAVCRTCGVQVTNAKSGRLVHLDDIPTGFSPDHEIVATSAADFLESAHARVSLKGAAEDMLAHHDALHPGSECPWADVLRRALASA
jgi:hypothetical protein